MTWLTRMADAAKDEPAKAAPKNGRVKGNTLVAGAGLGVVAAFVWNILIPAHPMPGEVAAALPAVLGPVFRWLAGWLPEPHQVGAA